MRRWLILIALLLCGSMVRAQAPGPEEIQKAISKGVAAIYALQKPDGTWEDAPGPKVAKAGPDNDTDGSQWGGHTAMAVYALLTCGEKPNDPKLSRAIEFLHTKPITGTYAVSVKCLVWLQLPATEQVRKSMNRDYRLLGQMQKRVQGGVPVWDYGMSPASKEYSLSRTQYATLGMWAASEMNYEIPADFWRVLEKTWETSQVADGGWKYKFEGDVKTGVLSTTTVCMTAAALASLYITQDFTKGEFYASARGNATSAPIEKGLTWLAKNFKERVAVDKKLDREFPHAQLYALERVGLASGLRRFGEHDWYAVGAKWLIAKQSDKGTWNAYFGPLVETSWAILFLQRGRLPVAFNKLDYTPGVTDPKTALWNQRPRDVANLTRWVGRELEKDLRWQIVRSDSDLAGLLESPILYLSGESMVEFKPEAKKLLKDYVEHGGLIVAHADVSKAEFGRAIMNLGVELFAPNEWRDLPDSHVIWSNQNYKRQAMKTKLGMKGISNGVRELMLLIPNGDPARIWQLRNPSQRPETWQTAANILSYVADKTNFYARGESWLAPISAAKPTQTVTIGRLKYTGNWDPEPQALVQLGNYARAKKGIEIKTQVIEAEKPISNVNVLLINGTTQFQLSDAARAEIRKFAEAGGLVLFEAAGGNGAFAGSAEMEMSKIFGAENIKLLPAGHKLYGTDLKVSYRIFNIMSIPNPIAPGLRGVEKDGRVMALYSAEDLSAGWLGVPTDGILGYAPESSRSIMTQILATLKK